MYQFQGINSLRNLFILIAVCCFASVYKQKFVFNFVDENLFICECELVSIKVVSFLKQVKCLRASLINDTS